MNRKNNYAGLDINYAKKVVREDGYVRLAAIFVGVLAVGGALFFGYRSYTVSKERAAQLDLGEGLREYSNAQMREGLWPDVEELFKAGHDRNKGSRLAPYFTFFQANALIEQNKKEEALLLMDQALNNLPSSSSLYSMYATKRALINIDLGKEVGVEQLKQLAYDEKNLQRDLPLYYLGLYYWSKDDLDAAQSQWELLVSLKNDDQKATSEWIAIAEKKLKQIV